mmetsp:Transcript_15830/g.28132  ORF Transcript_15830/g.28132 Transcript_15830/m.28132 type:complete len:123 (+) Transcript_15830:701-1069(+)
MRGSTASARQQLQWPLHLELKRQRRAPSPGERMRRRATTRRRRQVAKREVNKAKRAGSLENGHSLVLASVISVSVVVKVCLGWVLPAIFVATTAELQNGIFFGCDQNDILWRDFIFFCFTRR